MDLKPHEIILTFILALAASILVPGFITHHTADRQNVRYTLGE